MIDPFSSLAAGLESPPTRLIPVTPSDTNDLPLASRAINVATDGTAQVTSIGGDTASVFISAGSAFPLRVRRIWATGTTATGIVALL